MEKKKIIIAAVLVVALALLFFLFRKKQAEADNISFQLPSSPVKSAKKASTSVKAATTQKASIPTLLNPSTPSFLPVLATQTPKLTAVTYAKAARKYAVAAKGKVYDKKVDNLVKEASSKSIRFTDILAAYYNTYKGSLLSHLNGKVSPQFLTYLSTLS